MEDARVPLWTGDLSIVYSGLGGLSVGSLHVFVSLRVLFGYCTIFVVS